MRARCARARSPEPARRVTRRRPRERGASSPPPETSSPSAAVARAADTVGKCRRVDPAGGCAREPTGVVTTTRAASMTNASREGAVARRRVVPCQPTTTDSNGVSETAPAQLVVTRLPTSSPEDFVDVTPPPAPQPTARRRRAGSPVSNPRLFDDARGRGVSARAFDGGADGARAASRPASRRASRFPRCPPRTSGGHVDDPSTPPHRVSPSPRVVHHHHETHHHHPPFRRRHRRASSRPRERVRVLPRRRPRGPSPPARRGDVVPPGSPPRR